MAFPNIDDFQVKETENSSQFVEKERRSANLLVRNVRDRRRSFSGASINFDKLLLVGFAKTQPMALFAISLFGFIAAMFYILYAEQSPSKVVILLWLIAFITSTFITQKISISFVNSIDSETIHRHVWERIFTLLTISTTLVWCMAILYAGFSGPTEDDILLLDMSVGYAAVVSILYSSIPKANRINILILIAFETIVIALNPELINNLMVVFSIIIQFFLMILSKTVFEIQANGIRSEAEKDQLIIELEMEKTKANMETKRAEEANASKSRFLAAMSHELRTPMNAILGFSEVMMNEVSGKHEVEIYKEYSEDIHNSGQHLLKLINELLELSKIEAGHHKLVEESCSLTEIAASCARMMKMRAQDGHLDLITNFEKRLPNLWADNKAIRQVLLNLISNAIKFTPKGGTITITVGWTASGGQYMSVQDTGQGIPQEEIPVILSSFGQGSQKSETEDNGTGLGLPITKSLVELHDGKFILTSEVGVGTQILATFPAKRIIDPSSVRRAIKKSQAA